MSTGCTKYTVNFAICLILLLASIGVIFGLSGAFSGPPEIVVKFRPIPGELRKSYGTPEVFRVSFNVTLKVPNYSYGLLTVPGNSCRNRNYFPDPELGTYGNYEFPAPDKLDHGHLITASFVNQSCMTNVMSNIAPQWSCFNQGGGTWFQHEAYLNRSTRRSFKRSRSSPSATCAVRSCTTSAIVSVPRRRSRSAVALVERRAASNRRPR